MQYSGEDKYEGVVLATQESAEQLNPRQIIAYREHRRNIAEWMLNLGKHLGKAEGYSHSTVKNRMNKLDLFCRWVWEQENRFVQDITTDHADQWMDWLARQDYKESTKCHYQKSAQTLFKWKRDARGKDVVWVPQIEYTDPSTSYQPHEYLTRDDRQAMHDAVMITVLFRTTTRLRLRSERIGSVVGSAITEADGRD